MKTKQILLALLLTVFALISFANEYYTAKTNLNVRTGKSKSYPVILTLQKGSEVEVIAEDGKWSTVRYFGKEGYVSSEYLRYSRSTFLQTNKPSKSSVPVFFVIAILVFVGWLVYFLYTSIANRQLTETITSLNRGEWSERNLGVRLLKFGIPAEAIFHDLYLKKSNGKFSQIDVVAVTNVGILVFEIKDYSGWIFGSGNQLQWTQVLAYGQRKYKFYNPIIQNKNHIAELRRQLPQIANVPFYSIIVFYGDCVLKEINFVPKGTFLVKDTRVLEVLKLIFEDNSPVSYTNESEIFRVLNEAVVHGGIIDNQIQHKNNIKDMLGKDRIFDD